MALWKAHGGRHFWCKAWTVRPVGLSAVPIVVVVSAIALLAIAPATGLMASATIRARRGR
jgi:hypothetical protein